MRRRWSQWRDVATGRFVRVTAKDVSDAIRHDERVEFGEALHRVVFERPVQRP